MQRPIAWNRWGQNVVFPVNSARPTSSVSWFVRLGVECSRRCTFDAQCSVTVSLNKAAHKVQLKCQQTLGYQQMLEYNEDEHRLYDAVTRRYESLWRYLKRQLMVVRSIIVILSYS